MQVEYSHCILFFGCFMNWPEPHDMSIYFVNALQGMFKQAYQFSKSHFNGVMVYRRCMHSTECSKYFFTYHYMVDVPLFAVFVVGARNAILKGAPGYIRVAVWVNSVWINWASIDNATIRLLKVNIGDIYVDSANNMANIFKYAIFFV